ncbi:hypothetical protein BH09PSE5_BH09PSE5_37740 [soil metagenome]
MKINRMAILLADDHPGSAEVLADLLQMNLPVETLCVFDGQAAVNAAPSFRPGLAILDIDMPLLNGVDAALSIRELMPGVVCMAVTGRTSLAEVRAAGAFDVVFQKPLDIDLFVEVVRLVVDGNPAAMQVAEVPA